MASQNSGPFTFLQGRVVAITGAASGIGRALAHLAASQGAKLALADWQNQDFETLRSELRGLGLSEDDFSLEMLDVSDRSAVFSWADATATRFGGVDILINNAGVSLHVPIEEMDPNDLKWLMDVNFFGVVHGVQAFLPHLIRSGRGHIVNLSSVFGLLAFHGLGAYVASKFAVRGFTEALEVELALAGHPVTVTCVHPGGIRTGIVRNGRSRGQGPGSRTHEQLAEDFDRLLARQSPEECARAIWRGIERKNTRLLVGSDAKVLDFLARFLPRKYRRLLLWLGRRSDQAEAARTGRA